MTDPIDIHEPIFDICHRLGLEPSNVAEIIFRPGDAIVTLFEPTANGGKRIVDGELVKRTELFKVTT